MNIALKGLVAELAMNETGTHVILACLNSFPEKFCEDIYEEIVERTLEVGYGIE